VPDCGAPPQIKDPGFLKKVSGAGRYYWKLPLTPPDIMAVLRALRGQQQVFAKSKFSKPRIGSSLMQKKCS
jgi:hypothetical protein